VTCKAVACEVVAAALLQPLPFTSAAQSLPMKVSPASWRDTAKVPSRRFCKGHKAGFHSCSHGPQAV
jgi:hypothetical protein